MQVQIVMRYVKMTKIDYFVGKYDNWISIGLPGHLVSSLVIPPLDTKRICNQGKIATTREVGLYIMFYRGLSLMEGRGLGPPFKNSVRLIPWVNHTTQFIFF